MAHKRTKRPACPNCDLPLCADDNYCPRCGQENHTHKLPLRHFLVELFAGLFNFDTKLLRTLRDLFWPPGLVIRNYNANKRARYVPPLRLYLFTSLVFFITLNSLPVRDRPDAAVSLDGEGFNSIAESATMDGLLSLARRGALTDVAIDSVFMAQGDEAPSDLERKLLRSAMEQELGGAKKAAYNQRLVDNVSKMMFALLPAFAFLLWLLNWKNRGYFSEHLVFALYFHTVVFALLLLRLLVNEVSYAAAGSSSPYSILLPLLAMPYLAWAMHTAYQRPWWKVITKTLIIVIVYAGIFGLSLAGVAMLTALA